MDISDEASGYCGSRFDERNNANERGRRVEARRPIMCMVSGRKCRPGETKVALSSPHGDGLYVGALYLAMWRKVDGVASLSGAFPEWT
jgi:hypothetical protein